MCHVYVLQSEADGNHYTGVTGDLSRRLREHRYGKVRSTKGRRPLKLVYAERFASWSDALTREAYFKTPEGGVIKQQLVRRARLSG